MQSKWPKHLCIISTSVEYYSNLYVTYGRHHSYNSHGHLCNYVYILCCIRTTLCLEDITLGWMNMIPIVM